MKKVLLISAGTISMSLGILGIFLPLLPTTPFLLLSSACFMRSSEKLHRWLTGHKLLGRYIKGYMQFRAISKKAKIISITMLWVFIGISALFFVKVLWIRLLLPFIAIAVSIHLLKLKTLSQDLIDQLKE